MGLRYEQRVFYLFAALLVQAAANPVLSQVIIDTTIDKTKESFEKQFQPVGEDKSNLAKKSKEAIPVHRSRLFDFEHWSHPVEGLNLGGDKPGCKILELHNPIVQQSSVQPFGSPLPRETIKQVHSHLPARNLKLHELPKYRDNVRRFLDGKEKTLHGYDSARLDGVE